MNKNHQKIFKKNSAYGRQSISRPMRIVAPIPQQGRPRIPKNTNFFLNGKKLFKTQKPQKRLEICQNQRYTLRPEVSNPSGSVVFGWTKNTQKPNFFEKPKKSPKAQKLKNVQRYAKISDTPFDQRSLIHREVWFLPYFVRQNQPKNKLFFAPQFQTTSKQKCSNPRTLLSITFPQGFRISKNIGHPTSGSGGKKTFQWYLKSEHTNRQTNRRTFRLIESIGPEGRCFENTLRIMHLEPLQQIN